MTNYIVLKIFKIFTWLYKKSSKHFTLKKRLRISKILNILHCQAKGLLPPAKRTGIFSIEFRDIRLHASEISKGYLSPSNLSLRVYDIPDTLSWYRDPSEWNSHESSLHLDITSSLGWLTSYLNKQDDFWDSHMLTLFVISKCKHSIFC